MEPSRRATYAVIDLDAVRDNARALCAVVGPRTRLLAVVKADAYGHGGVPVARAALAGGASWLGVACVDEGVALRRGGIAAPLLVLGPIAPLECRAAVAHGLAVALGSVELAEALSAAATAGTRGTRRPAAVHVELDTGMNRHGVRPGELGDLLARVRRLPGLRLEGLFTHFACAESPAAAITSRQLEALLAARDAVVGVGSGGDVLVHAANSAGTLYVAAARLDMVRAGIALYGYPPDRDDDEGPAASFPPPPSPHADGETELPPLRRALTWRTAVARRWTLEPGEGVSYGHTFRAERRTPVALLPVGYGDGLPRVLSGRGADVLLRGRRVPIIGRVCMDQTIVDVSGCIEAEVGDEVVLIGSQGTESIGADELGALAGTNSYETLCRLAPRVPRRYIGALADRA